MDQPGGGGGLTSYDFMVDLFLKGDFRLESIFKSVFERDSFREGK